MDINSYNYMFEIRFSSRSSRYDDHERKRGSYFDKHEEDNDQQRSGHSGGLSKQDRD